MKHRSQNRLAVLRRWLETWAELPRHTRQLVAQDIFEAFTKQGLGEHLSGTGVEFAATDDIHHDMRVRCQKLWRWMGASEETKPQPDKLFYIEQVIVAAMPEQIRTGYLNEVYQNAGLSIGIELGGEAMNPAKIAQSLIKEGSEAQLAVINLSPNCTAEEKANALRELHESAAATAAAISAIENSYMVQ